MEKDDAARAVELALRFRRIQPTYALSSSASAAVASGLRKNPVLPLAGSIALGQQKESKAPGPGTSVAFGKETTLEGSRFQ